MNKIDQLAIKHYGVTIRNSPAITAVKRNVKVVAIEKMGTGESLVVNAPAAEYFLLLNEMNSVGALALLSCIQVFIENFAATIDRPVDILIGKAEDKESTLVVAYNHKTKFEAKSILNFGVLPEGVFQLWRKNGEWNLGISLYHVM